MLKTELATIVAQVAALNRRDANEVIDSFVEQVTNALARGESVALTGFGRFQLKHVHARQGHHPKTGEPLAIPARNAIQFKAGTKLKEAVQQPSG